MKAIHNYMRWDEELPFIVSKVKDTKFESNSQQLCKAIPGCKIVSKVKDTKFELFLKSKILSLKAIHNRSNTNDQIEYIVSKVKDTKFESNSQQESHANAISDYCF